MPRYDKNSSERIGASTRRVERMPINSHTKRSRRTPQGGQVTKLFKLDSQDTTNPQSVVAMTAYRIEVRREGELMEFDELQVGDDVNLVEESSQTTLCLNPRRNLLDPNVIYFGIKVGKYWLIDNQAVFQSWSRTIL